MVAVNPNLVKIISNKPDMDNLVHLRLASKDKVVVKVFINKADNHN